MVRKIIVDQSEYPKIIEEIKEIVSSSPQFLGFTDQSYQQPELLQPEPWDKHPRFLWVTSFFYVNDMTGATGVKVVYFDKEKGIPFYPSGQHPFFREKDRRYWDRDTWHISIHEPAMNSTSPPYCKQCRENLKRRMRR